MTKRWEVILIIVLIVMLVVSFRSVSGYRQDNDALLSLQQRVENEVKSFVKVKEEPVDNVEALKEELSKVEAQLKAGSRFFPAIFNEIQVSDYILESFSRSGTEPLLFQPLGVSTETIGKGSYSVFRYQIKVRGTLVQVKTFITAMENNPYPAFRIDLMDLKFTKDQVESGFQLIFIADLTK